MAPGMSFPPQLRVKKCKLCNLTIVYMHNLILKKGYAGLQKVFGCYNFEKIFREMSNTIKNHYMHHGCQKNDSAISKERISIFS